MIVNTDTGEILDLSPLRRRPRGRVSRPVKRTYKHRNTARPIRDLELTAFLVMFAVIVYLVL